jgi:hypothetical protein
LSQHVFEEQPTHVDVEARGGVVQRLIVNGYSVGTLGGSERVGIYLYFGLIQQHYSHPSWACILLGTSINAGILREVNGPTAEVAAHITDKRQPLAIRHIRVLHSHDGFIVTVVQVGCLRVHLPLVPRH